MTEAIMVVEDAMMEAIMVAEEDEDLPEEETTGLLAVDIRIGTWG
jgi:hypothetical protein